MQKKVIEAGKTTTTDYLDGYIYEDGELKQYPHAEGHVRIENGVTQYVYYYKDQVNNVRLMYCDLNGDGSITQDEILQERNYYPFGLEHKGYNNVVQGKKNNYRNFQDQEFTEDLGLNIHEWKYRVSDPSLGRFWQVDPLAEEYSYQSPYNFSENRVIDGVELEGLEVVLVNKDRDPLIHSGSQGIKHNDKLVTVTAHGRPEHIRNSHSGEKIDTGAKLDTTLTSNSEAWSNRESNEGMTVVFYSCRTGSDVKDAKGNVIDKSIAQKMSASDEFKDVTIIAPDERVYFNSEEAIGTYEAEAQSEDGEYKLNGDGSRKNDERSSREGSWRVFKNGEQVGSYEGDWTPTNNPSTIDNLLYKEN